MSDRRPPGELEEIAEAISDGTAPDWESTAVPGREGAIEGLKLIERVARAFRSLHGPVGDEPTLAHDRALFAWGRLEARELLGEGGFGRVYRAWDPGLQREVALKLHHSGYGDRASARRTLEEARRLARVRHPNVVTVHGAEVHDGQAGFWTDLIEGRTLSQMVRAQGSFGALETAAVGLDLCRAVAAIHAAGLVHGDIKPSNVLRAEGGRIVLLDFGATREVDVEGAGQPHQLTAATTAPEVLRGEPLSPASDLYSLGATLFYLLTGRYPFAAESLADLLRLQQRDERPLLLDLRPDLPTEVVSVVETALSPEPGERHPSAGAMGRALARAAGADTEPSSSRGGAPARERRSLLRPASLAVAAAAVVVLLVLLLPRALRENAGDRGGEGMLGRQRLLSDVAGDSHSPTLSPDGRMVAFVSDRTGTSQIWVQPLRGGEAVQVTEGSTPASRPRWTIRDEIVFSRQGEGIWAIPALGGAARQLIADGRSPDVSTDGGTIVFQRGRRLHLADVDGGEQRVIEAVPPWFFTVASADPAFSPDGERIVYFHQTEGPLGDLWRVDLDSGERRRLTFDDTEASGPVFTPDGEQVVFSSMRSGSRTLWRVPVDGGEPRPLTTGAGEDREPVISSDGRTLLYSNVRNRALLQRFDPGSGVTDTILESRQLITLPRLSPDGSSVAYFQQRGAEGVHLFTVPAAGGSPTQITTDRGGRNTHPRWSPDGRHLYYYALGDRTFRRIPARGGESEVLFTGWHWQTHNGAAIHPDGERVAYTLLGDDVEERTLIVELAGGEAVTLPAPHLHLVSWSPDGRLLLGWRHDRRLWLCEPGQPDCLPVVENALRGVFGSDGASLFFHRATDRARWFDLFRHDLDSGREERLGRFGPFDLLSPGLGVGPESVLVWTLWQAGQSELWVAELE